jgi:transcriptional/translational regulatory protein YebC/TACO1
MVLAAVHLVIEALTDNRNKAAQEVKYSFKTRHVACRHRRSTWAFTKTQEGWVPNTTVKVSEDDGKVLEEIIGELEENDEVQEVYTNAE